jgi:hypothetical protein
MKILPVGGELVYADGRTDRETNGKTYEANSSSSQFFERVQIKCY